MTKLRDGEMVLDDLSGPQSITKVLTRVGQEGQGSRSCSAIGFSDEGGR